MSKIDVGQKKTAFLPGEFVAFIILVLIQTIPVFYFRYFSTWDGPAHLGSAVVLNSYHDPGASIFREYFFIDWLPAPNLLGHLILAVLLNVLPPIFAEKILIALILVLLPLSARYCINALNPDAKYLSYLFIPLANNWFIHAGFHNFSLSLSLFFFALGYWTAHREKLDSRDWLIFSLLIVMTYLSHIVSFVMLLFFMFGFILLEHSSKWMSHNQQAHKPSIGLLFRDMGRVLAATFPSLVLAAIYFLNAGDETHISRQPLTDLAKELVTLRSVMLVFHRWEYFFIILLSLTVLSLAGYMLFFHVLKPGKFPRLLSLVIPIFLTVLYFAAPNSLAEGSFLNARLAVYVYFSLLIWLVCFDAAPMVRRIVIAASIVIMSGLIGLRVQYYAGFNKDLSEFLSATQVLERNSTILPLFYVYDGAHGVDLENESLGMEYSLRTRPLDHAAGYLMSMNGVVDLAHYESEFDYFLLKFRPEVNPFVHLGAGSRWTEYIPADVNIANYSQQSIGSVDYVLVWGMNVASQDVLSDPRTILVAEQLAADYELIFVSEPRGLMQVYKRLSDP